MAPSDKPGYSFNPGAPAEVTRYFRNRELRPAFSWQDVEPAEHAVAFTVAKAMQIDVLQTIRDELDKALQEGIPFEQFKRDLKPKLQQLGWWGDKKQIDPETGRPVTARLGSPRRLRTIYRANMRSARAAGQWDRIQRTKRALPYLVYLLGPSERHRPHHQAKEGLVLPVDDPFWTQWYPPNGWGCKCHVRQITRREAERRGVSQAPEIPMREVFNPRTGEIKSIPSGIDPGWEGNPGLARQKSMERFLTGRLDSADPAIARVAARDMASSWRVQRIHDGSAGGAAPIAMLPDNLADILGAQTRVVQYSDQTAQKMRRKHREAGPDALPQVADLLETGKIVKEASQTGTESLIIEGRGDRPWRLVLKRTRDGREVFVTSYHRSTAAKWAQLLRNRSLEIVRE